MRFNNVLTIMMTEALIPNPSPWGEGSQSQSPSPWGEGSQSQSPSRQGEGKAVLYFLPISYSYRFLRQLWNS